MITALKNYDGACFECPDFLIIHTAAGYEIRKLGWDGFRSIPEREAIEMANLQLMTG